MTFRVPLNNEEYAMDMIMYAKTFISHEDCSEYLSATILYTIPETNNMGISQ